jgi:hypothetical protein
VTSGSDSRRGGDIPATPGRSTDAGRSPGADSGPAAMGFTRATVLLIVGLLVFAACCAVVILAR